MRKIVCVSVPFVLSQYHLSSIRSCLESLKASKVHAQLFTIGVINAIRANSIDEKELSALYDRVQLNDENILAKAWNIGIKQANELNATHILIHNLDIHFHPEAVERLANAADKNPEIVLFSPHSWKTKQTLLDAELSEGISFGGHMSCFMIRPNFINKLGEFDELFAPAYQEDSDMFYRMHLNGLQAAFVNDSFMYHAEGGTLRGCLTIEGSSAKEKVTIAEALFSSIKQNDMRYATKWGGTSGKETFRTPFNLKDCSISSTKQSSLLPGACSAER